LKSVKQFSLADKEFFPWEVRTEFLCSTAPHNFVFTITLKRGKNSESMETSDERNAVLETGNIKKQQFSIQKFNCLLLETQCFTAGRHR